MCFYLNGTMTRHVWDFGEQIQANGLPMCQITPQGGIHALLATYPAHLSPIGCHYPNRRRAQHEPLTRPRFHALRWRIARRVSFQPWGMAMKTSHVWIVEIEQRGKWMPSWDALLTKREALEFCAEWQGVALPTSSACANTRA